MEIWMAEEALRAHSNEVNFRGFDSEGYGFPDCNFWDLRRKKHRGNKFEVVV